MSRPSRRLIAYFGPAITIAVFIGACSRPKEEAPVFRFVDALRADGVIASPFQAPDPANPSLAEVASKRDMTELGTGENPFGLKKKLRVGDSSVSALLAVPPTTLALGLKVPAGALLSFGCGLRRDAALKEAPGESRSADFSILVSAGGPEEGVFRKTLRLDGESSGSLEYASVDLSRFAGRDVSVRLVTEGDGRAQAVWANPLVYVPKRRARAVVLISLDTLRADHVTCYGYGRDTTPNIDLLAGDGVRFDQARSAAPWTLPSHVSMMTGLGTINHGVLGLERSMDPAVPMLAELLKARGFASAAFTGGGLVDERYGFDRGFESYETSAGIGDPDASARTYEKAARWLEGHGDRDVFLFLHTYQIHMPYRSRAPWNARYREAGTRPAVARIRSAARRLEPVPDDVRRNIVGLYDGAIRYTDEHLVGPLVAKLKDLGLYDRTLIVLTADHGEEFYEHKAWLHGYQVYDEVLRVPLVLKRFGSRSAGTVVRTPVFGVDVMPTIAAELGLGVPSAELDGRSLLGLAEGGDGTEGGRARVGIGDMYYREGERYFLRRVALIRGPQVFIFNGPHGRNEGSLSHARQPPKPEAEIFDVSEDPGQTRNLAEDRPDLVEDLRTMLRELYQPRRKPGPGKVELGKDLVEALKTLGYL